MSRRHFAGQSHDRFRRSCDHRRVFTGHGSTIYFHLLKIKDKDKDGLLQSNVYKEFTHNGTQSLKAWHFVMENMEFKPFIFQMVDVHDSLSTRCLTVTYFLAVRAITSEKAPRIHEFTNLTLFFPCAVDVSVRFK